ncbi:hypothetical protein [Candidatus Puniceispirillum sp.]|uniref:hypothetical protein n=1 Tax=Candidatus Puniceispirillum sp. TaxID=2026719 RepID=UPI003F6A5163
MSNERKNMNDAALKKLGVKRVSSDSYHVGTYKYSRLDDALAEAKRASEKKNSSTSQ